MAGYGLECSFLIDDGQLEGLSPQEVFVLGYELAIVIQAAKSGQPYQGLIHAANRRRVEHALEVYKRHGRIRWLPGDVSEDWLELEF